MADIKTRDAVKGTIKTINKAAIASERMKSAYTETKENAEQGCYAGENSVTEYAADKISHGADRIKNEGFHQFHRKGQQAVRVSMGNIGRTKEKLSDFRQKQARKAAGQKQAQVAGQNGVRFPGGDVRRSPVCDTSVSGKPDTAQAAAKASVITARKAQAAAKISARTAVEATKAAVRGTVATVKAIIAGTKALITAILAGSWTAVMLILILVLFGCAVAFFGGESSNSYTPVSEQVEAYEPLIRQYARQHGIPEYVELIKAVMMQESGGQGNDPMQASECGYNTRYPNTPGGITDPEYSIMKFICHWLKMCAAEPCQKMNCHIC